MTALLVVGLIIGAVAGYHVGIRIAERGIAKYGMGRTWEGRSDWRTKKREASRG